jgi:hypothetical protein
VDFHDAPEHHHAEMVKTYPKNWHPTPPAHPAPADDHHADHRDDHNDDGHHNQ